MPRPEARILRLPSTAPDRAAVYAVVMALAFVLLATSCNRLTFVKPDTGRKGFDRTAPEVSVGATQRWAGGPLEGELRVADFRPGEYLEYELKLDQSDAKLRGSLRIEGVLTYGGLLTIRS